MSIMGSGAGAAGVLATAISVATNGRNDIGTPFGSIQRERQCPRWVERWQESPASNSGELIRHYRERPHLCVGYSTHERRFNQEDVGSDQPVSTPRGVDD